MGTALVDLFNQALDQAGISETIADPDENSFEAEKCNQWYDRARLAVFSAAHWPDCRAAFRLNLLATKDTSNDWALGDPQPGWIYAYGLPADYVHARWINNMEVFELSSYVDSGGAVSKAIVSNVQNAVLTYSRDSTDTERWDSSLYDAVMMSLSAYISYPLTRKLNKSAALMEQANDMIGQARAIYNNSQEFENERLAPWLAARPDTAYNSAERQNYIYPVGPLLTMQGLIND